MSVICGKYTNNNAVRKYRTYHILFWLLEVDHDVPDVNSFLIPAFLQDQQSFRDRCRILVLDNKFGYHSISNIRSDHQEE